MPFPQIHSCLMCEDAREERYRKATILGLYGIAPNVEIIIKDMTKPIAPLTFVLLGGPGGGSFRARVEIRLEGGEHSVQTPPTELPLPESGARNTNLIFRFENILFPSEGTYRFILEVDGEPQYQTTFRVRPGRPEEFQ